MSLIYNMFKQSDNNIFKQFKTNNLCILNNINKQVNYNKLNGNITKTFFERTQFDLELCLNIKLHNMNLNILPDILCISDDETSSTIQYNTEHLLSLREIIYKKNCNYIINELFLFIKYIKNYKVLIENLHIDNIYVDLKGMKFYIIDINNIKFDHESDFDFHNLTLSLSSGNFNNHTSKDTFLENLIELYNYNYT